MGVGVPSPRAARTKPRGREEARRGERQHPASLSSQVLSQGRERRTRQCSKGDEVSRTKPTANSRPSYHDDADHDQY